MDNEKYVEDRKLTVKIAIRQVNYSAANLLTQGVTCKFVQSGDTLSVQFTSDVAHIEKDTKI